MRILWITNIPLPPVCRELGAKELPMGGWMYSALQSLSDHSNNLVFAVATIWNGKELKQFEKDGITYYLLPQHRQKKTKYNNKLEPYWQQIKTEFHPDIVHIHGTEYPHGLAYIKACGAENVVASIQGLISVCARYYTAGIDHKTLRKAITFRDFILQNSILQQQADFYQRAKLEQQCLKSIKHVIGRTDWDKVHVLAINPNIQYLYCSETLRPEFYKHKWHYSECVPNSILISQAGYPLKGAHIVIQALSLVKQKFPTAKLVIPGTNITTAPWYKFTSYGKYLQSLIKQYGLESSIEFTGPLDEHEMCRQFLKCNVFVCPSSIENSPNSLGEAQVLGVPYLASNVGGISDLVGNNNQLLYRFEEYELLANKICRIFNLKENYSHKEYGDLGRYDSVQNTNRLLSIYQTIIGNRQ